MLQGLPASEESEESLVLHLAREHGLPDVGRAVLEALPFSLEMLTDEHEARFARATDAAAVVIHLSSPFAGESAEDPAFSALFFKAIAAGVRTIGYGRGLSGLALEARCAFLLGGVELLLDTEDPNFSEELARAVSSAVEQHSSRRREQTHIDDVLRELGIVAKSPAMRSTLRRLLRLASLGVVPVLLEGETGTGKEIAARILHARDPKRSSGPFVAVNCAALSKSLAESELFGHRRGAFSGAIQDRPGLVRAAHGGVLFLDEIGELDWDLQSKLLRVIQERCVLPVGDDRECPVDVRIVAASHRNLASLVDAGRFREDLFYRLSVVRVHLPPLRERREDVAPLAFHFAGKHAELHGGQVPDMDPDFLDALSRMQFLGNVRELENLIRVALTALDDSGPLSLRELPRSAIEEIVAARRAPAPTTSLPPSPPDVESLNLSQAIDACERSLIVAALARCQGSQVAAAKLLGVTPRTVFNKVHRHGIEPRTSRSPPSGVHAPAGRQKRSHG